MTGSDRIAGDRRIVDARCRVLRAASEDGIAMSFAALTHRAMVLVEVETADGLVGFGESWINYPPWAASERVATLREGVFPLLIGEDAGRIRSLQQHLRSRLEAMGRQWGALGPIMQAISAVDVALWDIAGKSANAAISSLSGGRCRDEIPVYASSLGPEDVPAHARRCTGYDMVKVKIGFGAARDERILTEARESLGQQVTLVADANQAWTLPEAIEMTALLRAFDVAWIEEPIRGDRLRDLETLHDKTGVRIATGENIYGRTGFAEYAASPAISVLQPDVAKTGGLTECFGICELAVAQGKSVMPHLYGGAVAFAATLQLAAWAPAVTAVEYDIRDNPLRDPLLVDPPTVRDGRVTIPQSPGIGVDVDDAAVAGYVISDSEGEL